MATTITPQIVTVNVSVQEASEPTQYQQSGALVSVGGTTLSTGTYQFIDTLAQLTAILSTAGNYTELTNMGTAFFAQGTNGGFYVLELGVQTTPTPSALATWDQANPGIFYAYLDPADWDGSAMATMASAYSSNVAQKYFFQTTTSTNISNYAGNKAVFAFVDAPSMPATGFDAAAAFASFLSNNPSPVNQLAPMGYRFLFGTTPWPVTGQSSTVNSILTAFGNLSYPGSQAGLSNAVLMKGTLMSGAQASYWYGLDYVQGQLNQALAAAIINGSNGQPPLIYNQAGINTLQAIAERVANNAVQSMCAQSVTVSAVPFATYVTEYPNNYAAGIYNGFSATVIGISQFLTITFDLNAVQFS